MRCTLLRTRDKYVTQFIKTSQTDARNLKILLTYITECKRKKKMVSRLQNPTGV